MHQANHMVIQHTFTFVIVFVITCCNAIGISSIFSSERRVFSVYIDFSILS